MPVKFGQTSIRFWFFLSLSNYYCTICLYLVLFELLCHLRGKIETVFKKFTLECCHVRQKHSKLFLKQRFQDFLWHDRFLFTVYKHIPIVRLAQFLEKGPSFQEFNLRMLYPSVFKKTYKYTQMFLGIIQSNLVIRNGLIGNKLVLRNHFL